jgi:tight adherence protein C
VIEAPMLAVYAGFFLGVALFTVVVIDWRQERVATRRTLRGMEASGMGDGFREQQLEVPVFSRLIRPAFGTMGRLARRLSPAGAYDRIEQDLVYAGNPPGWDVERIFAFKFVLPFVSAASIFFLFTFAGISPLLRMIAAILFFFAGWYVPEWLVRSRAGDRQKQIQRSLPDSLDLMSISVEAGLAFDASLTRVSRNIKGPLGQEMYRVVQEMQLGKSRADALRSLAERTSVADLRSFVGAMVQADVFGVPIARVLKVQSKEIRVRRRQAAEEMAQKLPVKIVFPVVLTIFPSIFVVLLGPAAIQIYENILGPGVMGSG